MAAALPPPQPPPLRYWPPPGHAIAANVPQQFRIQGLPQNVQAYGPSWVYANLPGAAATRFAVPNPANPNGLLPQTNHHRILADPGCHELEFYNAGWGTPGVHVPPIPNPNTVYQNDDILPSQTMKLFVRDRRQVWDYDQCHVAITHNHAKGHKLPFYAHLRPTGLLAPALTGMDNLFYVPRHAVSRHGGILFPDIPSVGANAAQTAQARFYLGARWTVLQAMAREVYTRIKWHNDGFIKVDRLQHSAQFLQAGNNKLNFVQLAFMLCIIIFSKIRSIFRVQSTFYKHTHLHLIIFVSVNAYSPAVQTRNAIVQLSTGMMDAFLIGNENTIGR